MATTGGSTYDVIVIGSGMSGLATASLLARFGNKRVLVLESHFTIGGFLHSFKRRGYEWEPGFHYIGEMHPGSQTRGCMDLVTDSQVGWQQMEEFEHLIFPDDRFLVPSNPEDHKNELKARFPDEAEAIDRYFADLKKIGGWSQRWFTSKMWPRRLASIIGRSGPLMQMTTQDYLDANFTDPLLKAILVGQWGDYGTPPTHSAFGLHGIVAHDFLNGGFFPTGGSQRIADAAVKVIERHGGRCLTRHPVTEIIIEDNKARGVQVETRDGIKEFFAPKIVSAAGLDTTFNRLVPSQWADEERSRLSTAKRGVSATIVYLGLNDDPRNHGFGDGNYWVFDRFDQSYEPETTSWPPAIGSTTISFASTRNPEADKHVGQIVTFSWYDDWSDHADSPWKRRGDDYEKMKSEYTEHVLDWLEDYLPPVRHLIDHVELSTPVTVQSMAGHTAGQIYGRECNPQRVKDDWTISTSVKNLYLTGTDLVLPGVNSALMIGVMTAAKLLHPMALLRILFAASRVKPPAAAPTTSQRQSVSAPA
jgi:phytoene dehydrogenase-like protein